jgi:hypothetical protein
MGGEREEGQKNGEGEEEEKILRNLKDGRRGKGKKRGEGEE